MNYIKRLLLVSGLLCSFSALATDTPTGNRYRFSIDLTNVKDDKLPVTLETPEIKTSEIIYNMPKIVPGTYSVYDFGKFLSEFKAFDKKGKELKVTKLDVNRWKISEANKLDKITYLADDTWDTPKKEDIVFEPGGTNIEANQNFLINTHGFIGYFEGMKQVPYELNVTKPTGFYGATSLITSNTTATYDKFVVPNYGELVDSPLMYNLPDTTVLKVGTSDVLVSVYSPSKKVTSAQVSTDLKTVLEAQKNYLGGTLPVQKYAFLIYVAEKPNRTGAYGALEHSYSSVYYFPQMPASMLSEQVRNIAAHEFFHIVTPLNIHSEEIQDFDFINPQMSKHLWLYEGVTEYFSSHVQVNQKLYSPEEYFKQVKEYIAGAEEYNDTLPFTKLSKGALDKHKKEYGNVYQKGALIGMVLDIKLRSLSGGKRGLQHLMADLAKTYGKEKAFKDEELFDKITALTHPEIREFFRRYVEGPEPLPLKETFKQAGIIYEKEGVEEKQTLGRVALGYNPKTKRLFIDETKDINEFGRKLGWQTGDQILAINGKDFNPETAADILDTDVRNAPEGSTLSVLVNRPGKKGKMKEVKLQAKLEKTLEKTENLLLMDPKATPEQKQIQNAWLFGTT